MLYQQSAICICRMITSYLYIYNITAVQINWIYAVLLTLTEIKKSYIRNQAMMYTSAVRIWLILLFFEF